MMKVPALSLVGMERLPLPLPFSPELLWRYNPLGPPPHAAHHPPSSPSAALSRAGAPSMIHSPLAQQLPFAYDIKHTIPVSLASDPRLWSREDVLTFLQWCEREFDLPSFDTDRFQMNGKALCLLTKADLELRAPCSGDVIHNALQLLMSSASESSPLTPHTPSSLRMLSLTQKGAWSIADLHYAAAQQNGTTSVTLSPAPSLDGHAGSPPEHASTNGVNHSSSSASCSSSAGSGGNHSDDSEYDSVGESPERSPVNQQSHSPSPLPQQQLTNNSVLGYPVSANTGSAGSTTASGQHSPTASTKSSSTFTHGASKINNSPNNNDGGEYNNNGRLLWDFLQQLLNDPAQRYNSFIAWKNLETGIFKIVDPPGLARLWGIQKNHLSMNYDKMSRALRYYYRVNILRKVQGERHCYQFLRNPGELKSIKNISMLRHQQSSSISPVTVTVKCEPSAFHDNDSYIDDDMPTDLSMDPERHLKREESPTDLSMDSDRNIQHEMD